jgi:membrane protein
VKRISDILRYSINAFLEDNCIHWAASLSFYTFFSLIPILFLIVSVIGFVLGSEAELLENVIALVKESIPFLSDSIISNLYGLIERRAVYSWFSIFAIIWCAEFVLKAIRDAMIPIFGIVEKRGFILNMLLSWGVFLVAIVVVIFSITVTIVMEFLETMMIPLLGVNVSNFLIQSVTIKYFLPLFVMILATSVLLKMLAGKKIKFVDALWGGVVFAVLWELAKNIFAWYVTNLTSYNKIYGSLGTLMILLIWIFYSFNILLFGAELSHAISMKRKRREYI